MAEIENSKDLISVLWSGADILRSKMDANEYKDYLLGIVFYKYLSDSFLIKVYDMICDGKPGTLKEALEAYEEVLQSEDGEELKAEMKTAFEDQLVQKVMPKLRGIETRGKGRQSLQNLEDLLADEGFDNLKDDFEIACEQGYGQFVWSSAKYLGDDEENVSAEDNSEDTSENEAEE